MKFLKIGAVVMALLMVLSLAGCDENATLGDVAGITPDEEISADNKENESSAEEESASQESMDESSSQQEELSETFEAESIVIEGNPEESLSETLEDIDFGDDDFKKEFLANPLDAEFLEAFQASASTRAIGESISNASENWKKMISIAYQAALDTSETDERREEVKKVQAELMDNISTELEEHEALAAESPVDKALLNMNSYRRAAARLCLLKVENNGTMPSFDMSQAGGAAG